MSSTITGGRRLRLSGVQRRTAAPALVTFTSNSICHRISSKSVNDYHTLHLDLLLNQGAKATKSQNVDKKFPCRKTQQRHSIHSFSITCIQIHSFLFNLKLISSAEVQIVQFIQSSSLSLSLSLSPGVGVRKLPGAKIGGSGVKMSVSRTLLQTALSQNRLLVSQKIAT